MLPRKKKFETHSKAEYIHGGLFKKSVLFTPIYHLGNPIDLFENDPKYELCAKRCNDLIRILRDRNAWIATYESAPYKEPKKHYLTGEEKAARGIPEDSKAYLPIRTKRETDAYKRYLKKRNRYTKLLKKTFDFYKLVTFHDPENPEAKSGYPYFDLRYIMRQVDLIKWATVIRLEIEYCTRSQSYAGRGRPRKQTTYTREVLLAYNRYLDYALKHRSEIIKNPNAWAADKTIEEFPNLKIRASQLIKLGRIWRRK